MLWRMALMIPPNICDVTLKQAWPGVYNIRILPPSWKIRRIIFCYNVDKLNHFAIPKHIFWNLFIVTEGFPFERKFTAQVAKSLRYILHWKTYLGKSKSSYNQNKPPFPLIFKYIPMSSKGKIIDNHVIRSINSLGSQHIVRVLLSLWFYC